VGEMNDLARWINFNQIRTTSVGLLLGSALPKGQVLSRHKGNQSAQIIMKLIINGSRYSMGNPLK